MSYTTDATDNIITYYKLLSMFGSSPFVALPGSLVVLCTVSNTRAIVARVITAVTKAADCSDDDRVINILPGGFAPI